MADAIWHVLLVTHDSAFAARVLEAFADTAPDAAVVWASDASAGLVGPPTAPDVLVLPLEDLESTRLALTAAGFTNRPAVALIEGDAPADVASSLDCAVDYAPKSPALAHYIPHAARRILRDWRSRETLLREHGVLARARLEMDSILNTVPDIIYRLDREAKVTFVNRAVRRYGYAPDELIGRSIMDFIHPDDRPRAWRRVNERRTGMRGTHGLEVRFLTKERASVPVEVHLEEETVEPVFMLHAEGVYFEDEVGGEQLLGTQGIARDITRRKRAEELTRLMLELSLTVDSARDAGGALQDVLRIACALEDIHCGAAFVMDRTAGAMNLVARHGAKNESEYASLAVDWHAPELRDIKSGDALYASAIHPIPLAAPGMNLIPVAVIPVLHERVVLGALVLASRTRAELPPHLHTGLETIGVQAGHILHRIRAEEALRESEERYRRLTEAVTDYIFTVRVDNGETVETKHGPTCEAVTGYSVPEFEKDRFLWISMVPPEDHPIVVGQVRHIFMSKTARAIEHRIIKKDGVIRWVRNTCVPHLSPEGKLLTYDGLIRDITDQKQAEWELQKRLQFQTTLLDTIPGPIYYKDTRGKFQGCNRAFEEMVAGMSRLELVGLTSLELPALDPDTSMRQHEMDLELMRGGGEDTFEERITSESGHTRDFLVTRAVYADENSAPAGVVAVMLDITEQRQAERLIAEQRAKMVASSRLSSLGVMASGIAHEVNNPLAVISTGTEQLRDMFPREAGQYELARKIANAVTRNVDRIERIIRGLRHLARDGEGAPFEKAALYDIVEDTLALCRARFLANNIRLEVRGVDEGFVFECRPAQVSQALLNLLNNAFDAAETSMERWVIMEAVISPESLRLSVTDSGPGIPPAIRERLFVPFFTTKPIGRGTGIGLSISRGLIEKHGGRLFLDTEAPNTAFVICLPLNPSVSCPDEAPPTDF